MKKVIALLLSSMLLTSAVACSNTSTTNSSTATSEADASKVTSTEPSDSTANRSTSTLGMPSWIYNKSFSFTGTHGLVTDSTVYYPAGTGGLFGYTYNPPADNDQSQTFSTLDSSTQYENLNFLNGTAYAQSYTPSTSDVYTPTPIIMAPLEKNTSGETYEIPSPEGAYVTAPVFIHGDLYYLYSNSSKTSIQKINGQTKEDSTVFEDPEKEVSSFVYDEDYLYFQASHLSGGEDTASTNTFTSVCRVLINDPTNVDTFTYEEDYQLQFANEGTLYYFNMNYDATNSASRSLYAKGIWGEDPADFLATIEDGETLSAFQPYKEGYAVLSTNEEGDYILSYYNEDGTFEKQLQDPISHGTDDGAWNVVDFESYGDSLICYTTSTIESGDGLTSTTTASFFAPDGTIYPLPTPQTTENSNS